ncbi:MAG: BTAD domain-containing putative transcriptional regulator, partial [Burkholderiaceae bacterium]
IGRDDRKAALNWLGRLRSEAPLSGPHHRAACHSRAAWLAVDAGDRAGARAHVREALADQATSGDFFAGCNCVAAALTLLRLGDAPEEIAATLDALDGYAQKTLNPMLTWMAGMLRGEWLIERGDEQRGRDLLSAALSIGKKHDYLHFLIFPPAVISGVAYAALERGIEVDYVRRLITHNSLRPPSDRPRLELWPWPVRIYTLGRFGILRNGQKIEFARKAQRAPLRLLQATIALGGRQVAESQLIDALWPDSEGDAGANALTAAVHRLRQLIGDESLRRQEGRLSIDSRFVWVDAWALEQLLADARRDRTTPMTATEFAQRLRRLYQDDFLHNERDGAWALTYREKLHAETVSVLTTRIATAIDQGDWAGVAALSEVGLRIDDCVEAFHRAAIQTHLARNDPTAAVLAYRRCQRTLSLRLMAAPSAQAAALFHRARALVNGAESDSKG